MKNKGFTLIEIMMVLAIIGILCAIIVPARKEYHTPHHITCKDMTGKITYDTQVERAVPSNGYLIVTTLSGNSFSTNDNCTVYEGAK